MTLPNILVTILLLSKLVLADAPVTCEQVEAACEQTAENYRVLVKSQDELIVKLTSQRNDLAKEPAAVPWYFWTLVGAAGATLVIGVRR